AAFNAANRAYQIHHRLPLEYAHRLPGLDPNAGRNLIALDARVHAAGVNPVWTRLRTRVPVGRVTGEVVEEAAGIVDRHFSRWYNTVPQTVGDALETEITAAKADALVEMDALVARLMTP